MPSKGVVATSGRSWPNTRSSSGTHLSPLGQTWGRGSAPRSLRPLAPRVAFETLTPAERGLASRRNEDGHVPGGTGDARAALDDRHEDARCVQVSLVPGHATPVRCGPRRGERFRRRAPAYPRPGSVPCTRDRSRRSTVAGDAGGSVQSTQTACPIAAVAPAQPGARQDPATPGHNPAHTQCAGRNQHG